MVMNFKVNLDQENGNILKNVFYQRIQLVLKYPKREWAKNCKGSWPSQNNSIFLEIKKKTGGHESLEEDQETDDERIRTMVKSEMKYHPAWSLIMKEKGARKRQVQVFKRFSVRAFCFFMASLVVVRP